MNDLMLKYRPQNMSEVWGNEKIKTVWDGFVKRRSFPRAILLRGGFGSGKTTLGRIMGRDIVECLPKGLCSTDGLFEYDSVGVDIEMVRRVMDIRNFHHGVIVRFFDEVHRMPEKSQEVLLKPIEESENIYFILATSNPEKVDGGIISRCVEFELENPSFELLTDELLKIAEFEGLKLSQQEVLEIIESSNGSPRKCLVNLQSFIV